MEHVIRAMTIDDYDKVVELWRKTEGIALTDTDEREPMRRFLDRNPGLSLVAEVGDALVAAALCSHDGRRGYLHHLAVAENHRRQGIGTQLVQQCLAQLAQEQIQKCNIFFLEDNERALAFWQHNGFELLPHFGWMQRTMARDRKA